MIRVQARDLAARMRGRILSGDPGAVPTGASIDSRTIQPGQAFFAIRGERRDGHAFLPMAAAAGAAIVIVDDQGTMPSVPSSTTVIAVQDTTRALQELARSVRDESHATFCGVTGSVGKTTTKELARLLMSTELKAHASPGNLNNHYGLPLALLRTTPDADVVVLEMGISTPGEMDLLVDLARPHLGLVTRISAVHVGNFGTFQQLCDEKMKLARGSREAVLNADDPEQVARAPLRVRWYGESARAQEGLRLVGADTRGLLGSRVTLQEGTLRYVIDLPLAGRHQARNLAAAVALARAVGVTWESIVHQAELATPSPHRGEILRLGRVTIVDDSYNANPLAMREALALLGEAAASRRILVAGDMLELGDIAEAEHRALGAGIPDSVGVVVAVGPMAPLVAEGARAGGREVVVLPDAEAAGRWLAGHLRDGDVALVKGSRGIGLDRAVQAAAEALAPRPETGGRP